MVGRFELPEFGEVVRWLDRPFLVIAAGADGSLVICPVGTLCGLVPHRDVYFPPPAAWLLFGRWGGLDTERP